MKKKKKKKNFSESKGWFGFTAKKVTPLIVSGLVVNTLRVSFPIWFPSLVTIGKDISNPSFNEIQFFCNVLTLEGQFNVSISLMSCL